LQARSQAQQVFDLVAGEIGEVEKTIHVVVL
jgi:hypothetical protein